MALFPPQILERELESYLNDEEDSSTDIWGILFTRHQRKVVQRDYSNEEKDGLKSALMLAAAGVVEERPQPDFLAWYCECNSIMNITNF
jgi:hypothetical protein